jgi:transglutaminase-like putative cysteine protease
VSDLDKYQVVDEERMAEALVTECWPFEPILDDDAGLRATARGILQRWSSQGLPCRVTEGRRYYDPRAVFNFMKTISRSHGDRVWPSYIAVARRDAGSFYQGRALPASGLHSPVRFVVEHRREFNLTASPPGSVVRLRVPLPFEDPTQRDIEVEVVEPRGAVDVRQGPGRLEVKVAVPQERRAVAVEVRVKLTAFCQTVQVDPARLEPFDRADPEVQLYTRPVEGMIRVSERIARLAGELAGARNAWDALEEFWRFFFARMKLGYIHPEAFSQEDPVGALTDGSWVDCMAGCALLVSLCRARGIPARMVGGLCLDVDAPGHHYWFEVLLPPHGWFPVDLMSWDLALGDLDDREWSRHLFGRLDYRMKTECLPRTFTGHAGVSRPLSWYMVHTRQGSTSQVAHYALPEELIFRDLIRVATVDLR